MARRDRNREALPIAKPSWIPKCFNPTGDPHFNRVLTLAAAVLAVCSVAEIMSSTAYGRFGEGAAVAVSPRVGWWLMELPCTIVFVYVFFVLGGPQSSGAVPRFFAFVFLCHYLFILPCCISNRYGQNHGQVYVLQVCQVRVCRAYL